MAALAVDTSKLRSISYLSPVWLVLCHVRWCMGIYEYMEDSKSMKWVDTVQLPREK